MLLNNIQAPLTPITLFIRAFGLMNKPGIARFVIIPLFINVLLFAVALWIGMHYFSEFMDHMLNFENLWGWVQSLLALITPLLWVIFIALYLIFVFYAFSIVANIIAAPFNSLLAQATECYLRGESNEVQSQDMLALIKDVPGLIWMEIRKLMYFALRAIPLLILFVIPITAPIAPILWFVFSAWMLSLEYMDYPMGNHNIHFDQQKKIQQRNRVFSLSFGSMALLLTMLPLINFLVMPWSVISATLTWVERYSSAKS